MHKHRIISVSVLCIFIPAVLISGVFLAKQKQYLPVSLIIAAVSMLPFFLSLERKKLQVRELVIMASVVAVSVASRAAFFFLPQIKPMCALLIATAIAFGPEFGFVSAALSVLLSNLIFGQGIWTPFQMTGMGLTVFLCSLIFYRSKRKNRFLIAIVGGLLCFAVYGAVVDLSSVFMFVSEINIKSALAVFASGVPFNLIHGLTTAVILAIAQSVINEKLERIKIKYGLFGRKIN